MYTGLIIWLIVGGVAGWLAGVITKGKGYGCFGNVVVGIVGSIVGGWLFGYFTSFAPEEGLIGSIITSVVGAVALIAVLRLLIGK